MTFVSTFVATRLRQSWRAILSVLNKSLTRKDTSWDTARLPILHIIWGIVHSANLDFASLIWDEFEWQAVDRTTKPTKMSKLLYARFTNLIIDHFLSCNKNIPRRPDSEMHSEGQDSPFTKFTNTVKVESKKAKAAEEPEEQHVSPIKCGQGKGYMHLGDQEANVPNAFKKNVVPRKTRSLTIADNIVEEPVAVELTKSISIKEHQRHQCDIMTQLTIDRQIDKDVEDTYVEWGHKLKEPEVEDTTVQSSLDLCKGSKASRLESMKQIKQAITAEGSSDAHNKYYEFENISATDSDATRGSSCSDTDEEKDVETDDSDPQGDNDAA
ncbi:hypothetical protein Tco_0955846 [Tanacetum coccineum]|uniref:Uncharacterized protein n=1 Tax=Tanacetum coccineum TaxID=301880 RepID=A0ABQ5E8A5_9ASTR